MEINAGNYASTVLQARRLLYWTRSCSADPVPLAPAKAIDWLCAGWELTIVISVSRRRGRRGRNRALAQKSGCLCAGDHRLRCHPCSTEPSKLRNYLPFFTERHGPGCVPEPPFATTGTVPFRHLILLTASRLFDARILALRHR
jgi:hypothetical protein